MSFHLLSSSDTAIGKLIIFVIIAIIWGIQALAAMIKKAQEQQKRTPVYRPPPTVPQVSTKPPVQRIALGLLKPPPPLLRKAPPPPVRRTANVVTQTMQRAKALAQMVKPQVQVKQPSPPPALAVAAPMTRTQTAAASATSAASSGAQRPARAADAEAIRRWLQPQTMRKQFILTELLQPPLALRDGTPDLRQSN